MTEHDNQETGINGGPKPIDNRKQREVLYSNGKIPRPLFDSNFDSHADMPSDEVAHKDEAGQAQEPSKTGNSSRDERES